MIRFSLQQDSLSLERPAFHPGSGLIVLPNLDDATSRRPFIHESAHLYQTMSTPFGRSLAMGIDLRASMVWELARGLAKAHKKLYLDLRAWRDDLDDGGLSPESRNDTVVFLNRVIGIADRIERVLGYMLGSPTATIPGYGHLQGTSVSGVYFTSVHPPREAFVPQVEFRNHTYPLAGMALMETFAWYWTFLMESALNQDGAIDLTQLLLQMSGAWKNPAMFELYVLPLALAWEALGEDGMRWFPVMVDLALRGPELNWTELVDSAKKDMLLIKVEEGKIRQDTPFTHSTYWEDVHPGWRYLQILEFLKGKGRELVKAPFLGDHIGDFYPAEMDLYIFIEEICAGLNWPNPLEVAQTNFEKAAAAEDEGNFYTKTYRHLDRLYGMFPGSAAFPFYFPSVYEEAGLHPLPALLVNDQGLGPWVGILGGNQARIMIADMLLRPLGISWVTFRAKQSVCPFVSGPAGYCSYKDKSNCAARIFPRYDGCFLENTLKQQFGIGLGSFQWIG